MLKSLWLDPHFKILKFLLSQDENLSAPSHRSTINFYATVFFLLRMILGNKNVVKYMLKHICIKSSKSIDEQLSLLISHWVDPTK